MLADVVYYDYDYIAAQSDNLCNVLTIFLFKLPSPNSRNFLSAVIKLINRQTNIFNFTLYDSISMLPC